MTVTGSNSGNSLATIYRNFVPHNVRTLFYFGRRSAKALLRHGYSREFLTEWALVRVAAGLRYSTVRVNDLALTVDLQDFAIAGSLYTQGTWEPGETSFVRSVLKPGMTVVDVGANLGYFTTLFASLVSPQGRVFAFEPNPRNYALLARNLRQNQLTNAFAIQAGLGAETGEATLYGFDDNFGNRSLYVQQEPSSATTVKLETLDSALASHGNPAVDFIKMDIQGYEAFALQGMRETVRRSANLVLLTEFWPWGIECAGSNLAGFVEQLASLGFSASVLTEDGRTEAISFSKLPTLLPKEKAAFCNLVLRKT